MVSVATATIESEYPVPDLLGAVQVRLCGTSAGAGCMCSGEPRSDMELLDDADRVLEVQVRVHVPPSDTGRRSMPEGVDMLLRAIKGAYMLLIG